MDEASARLLRRLHVLICIVGLGLYVPGFVQQAGQAALPSDVHREALTYPVRVGHLVAGNPEQLRFVCEGWTVGARVTLTEADGDAHEVTLVARRDRNYLALAAFGSLFFWAMSLFAFTPRLAFPGGLASFWTTFPYGLAVATGGMYFRGDRPWIWSLPGHVHLLCLAALPVVFVWMTTTFPQRHPVRDRLPWLLPSLVATAAAVALWQMWSFEAFFREPGPARGVPLAASGRLADFVIVGQVALGVFFLAWQGRAASRSRERDQARWLFRGFLIGATPYVFLRTLPVAIGLPALLPAGVDRLFELAIPTTFLLVVARHRFLEIDVILRRGLIYGVVASLLLAVALALVVAARPIPDHVAARMGSLPWIALGAAVGLLFRPVRDTVAAWTDRNFFQLSARSVIVTEIDRALALAPTTEIALAVLSHHLGRALQPSRLVLLVREGGTVIVSDGCDPDEDPAADLAEWERSACADLPVVAAPGATDRRDLESSRFPERLRGRFVLAAPLRNGADRAGAVLIGERATGRHYVGRELEVLDAVAQRASAHLERLELGRRIREEKAESRRLEELHRAKGEFLSRVSHDLRTPLTSISWSVENLLDGVVGELEPRQREYVSEIAHSATYLGRLVENLLQMSRLERGSLAARCAPENVRAVAESAVRTVAATARTRSVTVAVSAPGSPARAWSDPHLLEEALVNLLENAVEFSPPGAMVDVTVETSEDGTRIRVRDRGPGLPPGGAATLFDRFTQGPRSPWVHHEGFGLGLFIAREHLHLMGGALDAHDHPEGGAVFTCSLASRPPSGEES